MILSEKILIGFTANSTSFGNLYSSHDSKCDYAKRPFRTFDANAKEKDYESGFHYYGSRYYSSELSIWNSTDPMADKYLSLTPYNYCANNPIKLIDPNGESYEVIADHENKTITIRAYYVIKDGDIDAFNSAKISTKYWNDQSNKFLYKVQTGQNSSDDYSIRFDLSVVYASDVNSDINANNYNSYSIVDAYQDNNVLGQTSINKISVKQSHKDDYIVGSHEVGHSLGLLHSQTGLMEEDGGRNSENHSITKWNVNSILKNSYENNKGIQGNGIGILIEKGMGKQNFKKGEVVYD